MSEVKNLDELIELVTTYTDAQGRLNSMIESYIQEYMSRLDMFYTPKGGRKMRIAVTPPRIYPSVPSAWEGDANGYYVDGDFLHYAVWSESFYELNEMPYTVPLSFFWDENFWAEWDAKIKEAKAIARSKVREEKRIQDEEEYKKYLELRKRYEHGRTE